MTFTCREPINNHLDDERLPWPVDPGPLDYAMTRDPLQIVRPRSNECVPPILERNLPHEFRTSGTELIQSWAVRVEYLCCPETPRLTVLLVSSI